MNVILTNILAVLCIIALACAIGHALSGPVADIARFIADWRTARENREHARQKAAEQEEKRRAEVVSVTVISDILGFIRSRDEESMFLKFNCEQRRRYVQRRTSLTGYNEDMVLKNLVYKIQHGMN